MKALIAILLIMIGTATAIDGPGSIAAGLIHASAADPDSQRMEAKLLNALQGLGTGSDRSTKDVPALDAIGPSNDSSNKTAGNSSAMNLSAIQGGTNTSALNLTSVPGAKNTSAPDSRTISGPGSTVTTESSISPHDVGSNTQGAVKGFWGIEANKHTMGGPKIHSRTFLTGNFDVDKTVKFQE